MSDDLVERINAACTGHPHARVAWPHRILHESVDEITHLRAELGAAHRMYDAALAALATARAQALEQAAKWHDAEAAKWTKNTDAYSRVNDKENAYRCERGAAEHRRSAAAMRDMAREGGK